MTTRTRAVGSTRPKGAKRTTRKPADPRVSSEQRYLTIQKAAYLRAERDGFRRDPCEYWLEAEAEADA